MRKSPILLAALFAALLSPVAAFASKGCVAGAIVVASAYEHAGTMGRSEFAVASGFRQTLTLPVVIGGKKAKLGFYSRTDDGTASSRGTARVTSVEIYGDAYDFRGVNLEGDTVLKIKNSDGSKSTYPARIGVRLTKDLDGSWVVTSTLMSTDNYPLFTQPSSAKTRVRIKKVNVSCGGFVKK